MKKLVITTLGLSVFVGNIYAQNILNTSYLKDYFVVIKPTESLKNGKNLMLVNIKHKNHFHNDLDTKLSIYSPNKELKKYTGISSEKNGQYKFSVNLSENGSYEYILTFNHKNGRTNIKRGSFEI